MTLEETGTRHLSRPAAKPVHPARLEPNLAALWQGLKRLACMMGCIFCLVAVLLFIGAPLEDCRMSWSASWALTALSLWICRMLYRIAEGEEQSSRRMQRKARRRAERQKRRTDAAKRIAKALDSIRNAKF